MASSLSVHVAKPEEAGGGESSEAPPPPGGDQVLLYRVLKKAKKERGCTAKDRISKMPPCTAGKRSSIYRGVTRGEMGKKDSSLLCYPSKIALGAYDDEEAAARAYDLAALKYWGPGTLINFPVTDYARDLEEMQNVSREDYLASLRRKSSGFSRGISKYRPPSRYSIQWDSQFGRAPTTDYINGGEMSTGNEYAGGYSSDRKIDLSNYIKWWGTNNSSQADFRSRSLEETDIGCTDDIAGELKDLESSVKSTEPYEMPRLGVPPERMKHKKISAMNTLLKSAAYKSLEEKILKKKERDGNDENENKNNIRKIELGKMVDRACHDGGREREGVAFGLSGGLSIHRSVYPLASLLSAPLTNYPSIDPLADSVLWSNLVPGLPVGSSHMNEVCFSFQLPRKT
ncbi:hypothetical protein OROMI_021976 [Orobanche minor]